MRLNSNALHRLLQLLSKGVNIILIKIARFIYRFVKTLIRLIFKFVFTLFLEILQLLVYPFRSLRNFLITFFSLLFLSLFILMLAFNLAFVHNTFGLSSAHCYFTKQSEDSPKNKVVRIVGELSQGSGFFIQPNTIITNFHVIEGEPAPKIIFPDGHFTTPSNMTHDAVLDLAALTIEESHPEMVLETLESKSLLEDTPLFAYGYSLGTDLIGVASESRGRYITTRKSASKAKYIQADIDLVNGMSGGPLADYCDRVVGVNTLGVAGLSMFVKIEDVTNNLPKFMDSKITKIELHPEESPAKAVEAFYTNLRLRRMEEGYKLLSTEYQKGATQSEWIARFTNILSVAIVKAEAMPEASDLVFLKFMTQNWTGEQTEIKYYEGTWRTVKEDGIYKLTQSNIKEVLDPERAWFYE